MKQLSVYAAQEKIQGQSEKQDEVRKSSNNEFVVVTPPPQKKKPS